LLDYTHIRDREQSGQAGLYAGLIQVERDEIKSV